MPAQLIKSINSTFTLKNTHFTRARYHKFCKMVEKVFIFVLPVKLPCLLVS